VTVWRDDLIRRSSWPPRRRVCRWSLADEAVARSAPGLLVGPRTVHPPVRSAVTRGQGYENPERAAIIALAPDIVIANREENGSWTWSGCGNAGLTVW